MNLDAPAREAGGFVFAEAVEAEEVEWLWADRIPRGALTVLAGDPGLGKSLLTAELAARVSRGDAIPPGSFSTPATVAMLSAEDALGAVVRPRLEADSADLSRVGLWADHAEAPPITFPSGVGILSDFVREHGAALVTIDPISSFLDSGLNAHRDTDVRKALRPLATLAAETGTAIVVVMHLNKSTGGQPMYRLGGSIGFAGAARSVLLFGRRPDAEEADPRRLVAVVKSSYARPAPSVELTLMAREGSQHPSVLWGGETSIDARRILSEPPSDEERSELDEAVEWLRFALADGESAAREVAKEARSSGISEMTLKRAKRQLGVMSSREGFGPGSRMLWRLPEEALRIVDQGSLIPYGERAGDPQWEKPYGDRDRDDPKALSQPIVDRPKGLSLYGDGAGS